MNFNQYQHFMNCVNHGKAKNLKGTFSNLSMFQYVIIYQLNIIKKIKKDYKKS